jgi:hypothetical protein
LTLYFDAVIVAVFVLLCVVALVVVAFLLKKFIVTPVESKFDSAIMF